MSPLRFPPPLIAVAILSLLGAGSARAIESLDECANALANLSAAEAVAEAATLLDQPPFGRTDPFLFGINIQERTEIWRGMREKFSLLDAAEGMLKKPRAAPEITSLARRILQEIRALSRLGSPDAHAVAGARTAVGYLQVVVHRDIPKPDGKPETKPNETKPKEAKKSKEEAKQEKQKSEQPPPPFEYPDGNQKQYSAKNEDIPETGEGNGQSSEKAFTWINHPEVRYFRAHSYPDVNARTGDWNQLVLPHTPTNQAARATRVLTVDSLGKAGTAKALYIPDGFVPEMVRSPDVEVTLDPEGTYWLKSSQPLAQIKLYEQTGVRRPLTQPELAIYLAHTGVELNEYPEWVRSLVGQIKDWLEDGTLSGPSRHIEAARLLAHGIAKRALYRDKKDGLSPLEAIAAERLQCALAATILIPLLRQSLEIPARIAAGQRGKSKDGDWEHSFAVVAAGSQIGHAWVEVPDEAGNWHVVDPTPYRKEFPKKEKKKEDKNDSKESVPFEDIPDPNSLDSPEEEPGNEDASSLSRSKPSEGPNQKPKDDKGIKDLKSAIAELERQKKNEADQRAKAKEDPSAKNPAEREEQAQAEQAKLEENAKQTEEELKEMVRSSGADSEATLNRLKQQQNPLAARFIQYLMFRAAHPAIEGSELFARIQSLKNWITQDEALGSAPEIAKVGPAVGELSDVIFADAPALAKRLEDICHGAPNRPLNETVDLLQKASQHLDLSITFANESQRPLLLGVRRAIVDVLAALRPLSRADAATIRIAKDMLENLPGTILRQELRKRFDIDAAETNASGLAALAKAIQNGALAEYRLRALLGPHTEFVTAPIRRPNQRIIDLPYRGGELGISRLFPTDDLRDLRQGTSLTPELPDRVSLANGDFVVSDVPEQIAVPQGFEGANTEETTVIIFDVSLSMSQNNKGKFQTDYMAALVDRALSKPGHRVMLISAGDELGEPIEINTRAEAEKVLAQFAKLTRTRAQGNALTGGLEATVKLIRDRNRKAKRDRTVRAVSRLTLLMMSDGGYSVDEASVRKSFASISDQTRILFAFAAIGESNPELQRLATGQKLGADRSVYIHWTLDDIQRLFDDAKKVPEASSIFWIDSTWDQLPRSTRDAFDRLRSLATSLASSLRQAVSDLSGTRIARWQQAIAPPLGKQRPEKREGSVGSWLADVRRLMDLVGSDLTMDERKLALETVLQELERKTGVPIPLLTQREAAHLSYVLDWVKTGRAGGSDD